MILIAKWWAQQLAKYNTPEYASLVTIYAGNAFMQILDEVIQEGILGLVQAANQYDPSGGLWFLMYYTKWNMNFVWNCFTNVASRMLHAPLALTELCWDESRQAIVP